MIISTMHTITLTEDTHLLDLVREYPQAFERVTEELYALKEGYEIDGYEHLYWGFTENFYLPKGWIFIKWVYPYMLEKYKEFLETGKLPEDVLVKYSFPIPGCFLGKRNPFTCFNYLAEDVILIVADIKTEPSCPGDNTKIFNLNLNEYGLTRDTERHSAYIFI